jgi:acetyl/propionyl-CoA carboxylase alpha subunit
MKLSVEADTRAQAVALALDAISKVRVDGVATNLIELKRLLVEENFVEGNAVTSSLHMWLASWAVDD